MYRIPSLSAIQILREANEVGIPIYLINQDNIDKVSLSIPYDAMEEIRGYVELGYEAIVPQREVSIMDWHGVGYVIRDPETYAGRYMINGGYGGGTFKEKIEEFLEQFLTPSSDIWTDLEGSTVPVLDAITETYGFFDDPNVNLLLQDNICAYIMSLGPLFLMSMFPSLPGFLFTLEWVSKMYVEFLNVGVINLDFRRTSYFRSLGRRRVKALVSRLLGEPLGGVLLHFRTTNKNSSIEPLEVETDSNGYAVAVFDGMSLSPGDTTSIIVRGEIRGKERHTVGGLYVRDNSNIRIKDVVEGRAVYVYDEGVESRSALEDTLDIQKKFDFVQIMLNKVLADASLPSITTDGYFGNQTENAIEAVRRRHPEMNANSELSTITPEFRRLMETYNIPEEEWLNWSNRIIDRGLLIGMELMDLPDGERDGLYELYFEPLSVYYNITPFKGLETERRLIPNRGANPEEYHVLGGIRVKIESDLSVFKEKYLIDGYEWSGTGGRFYRNYHVDSPEDKDLNRYKVYWESPEEIPYNGRITMGVRYREKSFPLVSEEMRKEIRLLTRELRVGLSGDDVRTFQDLLNWLGWDRYTSTHKRRIDGIFEDTTNTMFTRFTHMNWASNYPGAVNASVVHLLNLHYDDYRNALNRYGWDNGINSNERFATMGRLVNGVVDRHIVRRIERWVVLADSEVTTRLPSYSTLGMNPTHRGDEEYPQGDEDSFQWLIIKIICLLYTSPSPRD